MKESTTINYKSPYGVWEVTTEADCEGKSIKKLGVHEGFIDDIAFALADEQYYSLCFKAVNPKRLDMTPRRKEVNVSLDISSNTWGLNDNELVWFWESLMRERDVRVRKGIGFNVVTLSSGRKTIEDIRKEALAKLSKEEKIALGLE